MKKELEDIAKKLEGNPQVVSAYVHGSIAKGNARPDSDLDIAILCLPKTTLTSLELLMLTESLVSYTERELHLSTLTHDNLIFLREVATHGEQLFTKDKYYTDIFMCTGLSLAAKLHEDSREVINAYTA